jgi:octopine/nopaline transport system substrate-binding protein
MVETPQNSEMMLSGPRYVGGVLGAGVAVGIRKTDPELRDKFDAAVGAAIADGTVKTLSMKWFGFDITPAQR